MGWPSVYLSETARTKIAKTSSLFNCLCILPSLIVLSVGSYMQAAVQEKISLVEGFNGNVLPIFMIVIGFIGAIASVSGGKICWTNSYPEKRELWAKYLFPYVILELFLFIAVFTSAIFCFVQITMLEKSFKNGITDAMNKYKTDLNKKMELDLLQIEYSCCGSESYVDWFHISWVHEDYQPKKKEIKKANHDGKYLNDDVPFSCCNSQNLRPCIHHHIHDNDLHFNYDYRSRMTINKRGCKAALMTFYGDQLLTDIGILVFCISFLQLVTLILVRLLQTSIESALENDDIEEPSRGYILPFGTRAVTAIKTEVKKFHKTPTDSSPSNKPLLDGDDSEDDGIDADALSVTGSFDDMGDDDGGYEIPIPRPVTFNQNGSSHIYSTIRSTELMHNSQHRMAPREAARYVNEIPELNQ